jgi:hypothetical protein
LALSDTDRVLGSVAEDFAIAGLAVMAFSAKIPPISSMRPGDPDPEFSNDSITQPSHKIHRENVTSSLFVAAARPNAKIRVAPS